jgi:hypothetical protein
MKLSTIFGKTQLHRLPSIFAIFCILVFVFSLFFLQNNQTKAQASEQQPQVTNVTFENDTVYLGVWLNNIYSYDYRTGAYTIDMYLYFFWVNPNLTTADWYLMNGYPVNPATTGLVSSNLTSEVKYEIYRITAACSVTPNANDYPFDKIKLVVAIELLTQGYNMQLSWLDNQTGIDPGFVNAGWRTTDLNLTTSIHVYPLDAELPRAELVVTQERQRMVTSIQTLIVPLIFAVVSAFSFLFPLKDASSVGLRLGLNTSMLVTTLLFNFAASALIPPSSTVTIYALVVTSILIFMVMNLLVTIVGFVHWFYYKNEPRTKITNRWGLIFSVTVPIVFFIVLYFLRT